MIRVLYKHAHESAVLRQVVMVSGERSANSKLGTAEHVAAAKNNIIHNRGVLERVRGSRNDEPPRTL